MKKKKGRPTPARLVADEIDNETLSLQMGKQETIHYMEEICAELESRIDCLRDEIQAEEEE